MCGIVNSLISIDGEKIYKKFQAYIDEVAEALVRKDKDNVVTGKIIANGGIEGNVKGDLEGNAKTATSANYATSAGTASSCTGNANTATTANKANSCTRQFCNCK